MVDEILGRVGVVARVDIVPDEDVVGEAGQDGDLLGLGGIRLGGIGGAAEGVVLFDGVSGVRNGC